MRTTLKLAVVIGLVATLTSCSAAPAAKPIPTASSVSAAQSAALGDQKVSYDEYIAGFRRYVSCVASAGYTIQVLGEENKVENFRVPDAAVSSGADGKCYEREFKQLDQMWQVSRADTSPEAVAFHDCLVAHGQTPEGTYAGMVKQLQALGVDPQSCLKS